MPLLAAAPPYPTKLQGGHSVDGDTIHYWSFNGLPTSHEDQVGSADFADDRVVGGPGPYPETGSLMATSGGASSFALSSYVADLDPGATLPLTLAGMLYMDGTSSTVANRDILRHEQLAYGNPSFRFSLNTSDVLWVGRETPAWEAHATGITVPTDTWVWFALVFKSDGDVFIRMNDSTYLAEFVGGYETPDTAARFVVGGEGSIPAHVRVFSLIAKNIEASTAQLDAMKAECPLP